MGPFGVETLDVQLLHRGAAYQFAGDTKTPGGTLTIAALSSDTLHEEIGEVCCKWLRSTCSGWSHPSKAQQAIQ